MNIFDAIAHNQKNPTDTIDMQHWKPSKECEPTKATPGSKEKIGILKARVDEGRSLWHPEDKFSKPITRLDYIIRSRADMISKPIISGKSSKVD